MRQLKNEATAANEAARADQNVANVEAGAQKSQARHSTDLPPRQATISALPPPRLCRQRMPHTGTEALTARAGSTHPACRAPDGRDARWDSCTGLSRTSTHEAQSRFLVMWFLCGALVGCHTAAPELYCWRRRPLKLQPNLQPKRRCNDSIHGSTGCDE